MGYEIEIDVTAITIAIPAARPIDPGHEGDTLDQHHVAVRAIRAETP